MCWHTIKRACHLKIEPADTEQERCNSGSPGKGLGGEVIERAKEIASSLLILGVVVAASLGYARCNTSNGQIPPGIPLDLKREIGALNSSKPIDRENAAFRIGTMGEKAVPAIPFLIAMLGDVTLSETPPSDAVGTSPAREAAVALIKIGMASVEPLILALKHHDPRVRENAAWALGEIRDTRAVRPLIMALSDDDASVRVCVASALARITGHDFGEDPARWREWYDRCALRRCLGLILFLQALRSPKTR
jgi:HEAT repeat protein